MLLNIMIELFRKIASDRRGATYTEYIILLGTVGIGMSVALVALGPSLVARHELTRSVIASP